MLLELAERFGLELSDVVVIGDALSDIEAGQRAGCETILVLTGRGREQLKRAASAGASGFKVASDLSAAVPLALQRRRTGVSPQTFAAP
jgi:D-glycero-D-manno-heptose 1,7-bisphosphate phosphatase